jgi:hypothetical protein
MANFQLYNFELFPSECDQEKQTINYSDEFYAMMHVCVGEK